MNNIFCLFLYIILFFPHITKTNTKQENFGLFILKSHIFRRKSLHFLRYLLEFIEITNQKIRWAKFIISAMYRADAHSY